MGYGAATGRGLGYCSGYDRPGFAGMAGFGAGRGCAGGRGMAWRRGGGGGAWGYAAAPDFSPPVAQPGNPERLKEKIATLEQTLAHLKQQMAGEGREEGG